MNGLCPRQRKYASEDRPRKTKSPEIPIDPMNADGRREAKHNLEKGFPGERGKTLKNKTPENFQVKLQPFRFPPEGLFCLPK